MADFDRLSALDQSFLDWETPETHMHVASTFVFDAGPVRTEAGGIDFEAIRKYVSAALAEIPRYRQRLARIPVEGRYVWVDDDQFNIDYHLRHTALPRPGSEEQLKRLSSRIMAQPLDRGRPLWEMWVVEGLEDDHFAIVSKVHHCMIDGIAGVDLVKVLLSPSPEAKVAEPVVYSACRPPSRIELLASEAWRRARLPLDAVRDLNAFVRETQDVRHEIASRLRGLAHALGRARLPASKTPLNGPIGPHRRFEWLLMELDDVKRLSRALGATVNDCVLATVAGAVRRYLTRHGLDPRRTRFRTLAPVSVRSQSEQGLPGNRVSIWILDLPIGETDPLRRIRAIREQTAELKEQKEALGAELLTQVAEWTSSTLLSLGTRAAARLLRPFNMVVTNVPGPQLPLYLLGARLREAYPLVPLFENYGLGIALLSYDGKLCWGLNADYDRVPDVASFAGDLRASFEELDRAGS